MASLPALLSKHSGPPLVPRRYLPKPRIVLLWHGYLTAREGDWPTLKTLARECRLPPSTVHKCCRDQNLSLSQSRPRKPRS